MNQNRNLYVKPQTDIIFLIFLDRLDPIHSKLMRLNKIEFQYGR